MNTFVLIRIPFRVYDCVDFSSVTLNVSIPFRFFNLSTQIHYILSQISYYNVFWLNIFFLGHGRLNRLFKVKLDFNHLLVHNKKAKVIAVPLVAKLDSNHLERKIHQRKVMNFVSILLYELDLRSLLDEFIFYAIQNTPYSLVENHEAKLNQFKEDKLFELFEQATYGLDEQDSIFEEAA